MPYIVSGAIADDFIILGSIGAVLHVLAWVFAIVTDVLTALDTGGAGGSVAQLIMTILAFVFLVIVWVWHLVLFCTGKGGIPDGMIPPSILSFITGPVLISLIFSFLYLQQGEANVGVVQHPRSRQRRVPPSSSGQSPVVAHASRLTRRPRRNGTPSSASSPR